jgi:hypothetical protein
MMVQAETFLKTIGEQLSLYDAAIEISHIFLEAFSLIVKRAGKLIDLPYAANL